MQDLWTRILEVVEPLNAIFYPVQPILSLIASLFGLGTFAFIARLHWALRSLRDQAANREQKLRELEKNLKDKTELAVERGKLQERLKLDNEDLKALLNTSQDDARRKAATLGEKLTILEDKLGSALDSTSYMEESTGDPVRFWAKPATRWDKYTEQLATSIPILFFGTQKGGVGKTMTATNLAACLAHRGERVLVVDLDYQGSSSAMLRLEAKRGNVVFDEGRKARVDVLFQTPPLTDKWPELAIRHVNERLHYIEAWYGFEALERSLEYRWILSELGDDARYRLARALLSSAVQSKYDRVILDAPPRFTMGFVNGVCAATHVFVPTLVDPVSAGGVEYFFSQFRILAPAVNPALKIYGVIGTVNNGRQDNTLPQTREALRTADYIDKEAGEVLGWNGLFIRDAVITKTKAIATAAESGIPYMRDEDVRPAYDNLADIIIRYAPGRKSHANRAA